MSQRSILLWAASIAAAVLLYHMRERIAQALFPRPIPQLVVAERSRRIG